MPFDLAGDLEDLVGEAATRDFAGDVLFEAVFSFAYSNSVSSFLADCLPARLAPEAATAGFFAVDWEGFLYDFLMQFGCLMTLVSRVLLMEKFRCQGPL